MDPTLIAALLSSLPGLLGALFGDPNKKLRGAVRNLTSAGNIGKVTNQFYQQALGSPAYAQAQGAIAAGANTAQGQLASSLGARGLGTSGTASILGAAIPSMIGGQQAGLRTSAYGSAQSQAQQSIEAQLRALLGTQGPSPAQQGIAGGIEAFAPYLRQLLANLGRGGLPRNALAGAANYGGPPVQPRF